jgi:hypothetical protein
MDGSLPQLRYHCVVVSDSYDQAVISFGPNLCFRLYQRALKNKYLQLAERLAEEEQ